MQRKILFLFLFLFALVFFQSCKKATSEAVPISLTDKDGNIFIPVDTALKSFVAYSSGSLSNGTMKGIFSDTLMSSFQLAIATEPYWDTTYHAQDTIVFPNWYPSHTMTFQANLDLSPFTTPYHFLLLGVTGNLLRIGGNGKPSVRLTMELSN
ncbi:MAG: hypothetical protein NTU98_07545 [Bacteroidetes bacterium]|nr:hypothetical protein [Bacteroidota bacterium]